MRFLFLDAELERSAASLTVVKHVAADEPYLEDHFPTFPVMPGVLMLEAMAQAARALVSGSASDPARLALREVRAVRYGAFVKPGDTLRITVELLDSPASQGDATGLWRFKGRAVAVRPSQDVDDVACAGRFALGPVRTTLHEPLTIVSDAGAALAPKGPASAAG